MVTSEVTMKRAKERFTYQDYLQLPEDQRYEILEGELYVVAAPNTRHQRVTRNLVFSLFQYVRERDLGELLPSPYDVILSEENVVQPDILFVCRARVGVIGEMHLRSWPDLVVEILSPGTRKKDLVLKRKIYARYGVPEYWVVDPDAGTVEVLVLIDKAYTSAGTFGKSDLLSSPLLPELKLPLSTVFPD
jgi:Uma2 family endonuclease